MDADFLFLILAQVLGIWGILCCGPWFLVLYLGDLRQGVFPTDFRLEGDFPGKLAKNLDGGCRGGANCGSEQRCFESVRRQFVGAYEQPFPAFVEFL